MNELCPFCGKQPEVIIDPLWHGSHGYPNCFEVSIACRNEKCLVKPKTKAYHTINGDSILKQQAKAWKDWNTRPPKERKP